MYRNNWEELRKWKQSQEPYNGSIRKEVLFNLESLKKNPLQWGHIKSILILQLIVICLN